MYISSAVGVYLYPTYLGTRSEYVHPCRDPTFPYMYTYIKYSLYIVHYAITTCTAGRPLALPCQRKKRGGGVKEWRGGDAQIERKKKKKKEKIVYNCSTYIGR